MKTSNTQFLASNFVLVVAQWLSHVHGLQNDRLLHSTPSLGSLLKFKFMSIESMILSNHLILCCPFSFCLQSFSASGYFPVSQLFTSSGQNNGASASASFLPMNVQGWFPLGLTDLISLQWKGLSRAFSSTTIQKHPFFGAQPSLWSCSHMCTWLLVKPRLWLYGSLSVKWCLCFLTICCLGLHSFPSKEQVSFNFMAPVTVHSDFGTWENKICHCFHVFPFYLPQSDGTRCYGLFFKCWASSQLFHSPLSPSSRDSFIPLWFLSLEWHHLHIWDWLIILPEILIPDSDTSSLAFHMMYSMLLLGHFSHVWLFATLWTVACQPSLPMGFSRQE